MNKVDSRPKISQFKDFLLGDQNVVWFDVDVDNVHGVDVFDSLKK